MNLQKTLKINTEPTIMLTASINFHVKSGPSLGYHTIAKLPVGTVVEITDRQGCWCKVRAKNLNEGYVLAILLDKN